MRTPTDPAPNSADLVLALGDLARCAARIGRTLCGINRKRVADLRSCAYSAINSTRSAAAPTRESVLLLVLTRFALEANGVAHNLPEYKREAVFALKSGALSVLVLYNAVAVNDISADGTVGLDLVLLPGKRLHCPISLLQPAARTQARRLAAFVPVSAPVSASVSASGLEGLLRLVARAA